MRLISIVLLLLGLGVLNYPPISTLINNVQLSSETRYSVQVAPSQIEPQLKAAQEYNKNLNGIPILDPWLNLIRDKSNVEFTEYKSQLSFDDKGLMGRILVPSQNIALPIYHDATEEHLKMGAAHLFGSSLPVDGETSHAIITGHTGLSSMSMFDNLINVKVDDEVYVDYGDRMLAWKVSRTYVILPDDVKSLGLEKGHNKLSLITCTPYGINDHRLVVEAERDPASDKFGEDARQEIGVPSAWDLLPTWGKGIFAADGLVAAAMVGRFAWARSRDSRR